MFSSFASQLLIVLFVCFIPSSSHSFIFMYIYSWSFSFWTVDNVSDKWFHEVRHHCPTVPIVLVGTKTDLREVETSNTKVVSAEEGAAKASEIEADSYIECSSVKFWNVEEVFKHAVHVVLEIKKRRAEERPKCTIQWTWFFISAFSLFAAIHWVITIQGEFKEQPYSWAIVITILFCCCYCFLFLCIFEWLQQA